MVGVAVNVTCVPLQIVVAAVFKATDGVKTGLTVIVLISETGVVGAQVAFEIISNFATVLFAK